MRLTLDSETMQFPPKDVEGVLSEIASILRKNNYTLAVSEAACGGLISAYLVSIPGASDFYIGGKLVYSLKQRLKLSGWSPEEISSYTGPSEQVALKLARTTKYELGSTFVLSETGFAGPGVDLHLDKKPNASVGNVFLGLVGPQNEVSSHHETKKSDRSENMAEFARVGLEFLLAELRKIE